MQLDIIKRPIRQVFKRKKNKLNIFDLSIDIYIKQTRIKFCSYGLRSGFDFTRAPH